MNKIQQLYQTYSNVAEICHLHGLRNVVLSPGSRSAVLALSFLRHGGFDCHVVPDERSAAFVGLGLAQQTSRPTILICTSGTAGLNYAPAIAEAYFQHVPLLALTADRPPELIGQQENQTIFQRNMYGEHAKQSFHLPANPATPDEVKEVYNTFNEAIQTTMNPAPGPVHINVPFREPFYLDEASPPAEKDLPVQLLKGQNPMLTKDEPVYYANKIANYSKIMVIAGMMTPEDELKASLTEFLQKSNAVFIADTVSNLHLLDMHVEQTDQIILNENLAEELKPELLITIGGPVISKRLKHFLRENKPWEHWHISSSGDSPDTFQALTQAVTCSPSYFFKELSNNLSKSTDDGYSDVWKKQEEQYSREQSAALAQPKYTEANVVHHILKHLPANLQLQLGNSMPVRHVWNLGLKHYAHSKSWSIFSNRGTSGIDGSLSTAIGAALATDKMVTLILGDLSFMYDRNGLWQQHLPMNLKLIILNNQGGGIFRKIQGPSTMPELETYFTAHQNLRFSDTANQHCCPYNSCETVETLNQKLNWLYQEHPLPAILEVVLGKE